MSSLKDRLGSKPSREMDCVLRGLAFIREKYGEAGITRLKRKVGKIKISSNLVCALAIGSGKPYHEAQQENDLSIEQCSNLGFTIWGSTTDLRRMPVLTSTWQEVIRAL